MNQSINQLMNEVRNTIAYEIINNFHIQLDRIEKKKLLKGHIKKNTHCSASFL